VHNSDTVWSDSSRIGQGPTVPDQSPRVPRWRKFLVAIGCLVAATALVGVAAPLGAGPASSPLAAAAGAEAAPAAAPAAVAGPETVVSLTFDDGDANQTTAASILNNYNLDGTFYIISGYVGAAGYMTRADVDALAAAGHEIGGHTVNHSDLATLPADEVSRQICNDRATLTSWGYTVRSFAYPYASSTPEVEAAAQACGYSSARMLGDIKSRFGCDECDFAESIPPQSSYYTRALDQVESSWTLDDLKTSVTNAEQNGGGWVQLTFHNICDSGCGDPTTTPAIFEDFVEWLAPRAQSNNTVVQTVGDTIGGAALPVVAGPTTPAAGPGVNAMTNSSMETAGLLGLPECWMQGGYGANTPAFSTVSPGRTGGTAGKVTMTGYTDGDAKLLPQFDGGSCSPTVVPGHSYSLRTWYTSTAATQFTVYLRTDSGAWQYWTSSPWFDRSASYTEAVWQTPTIPAGMSGISFGLNIFSNGEITTDDYSLYDAVGAPAPGTDSQVAAPIPVRPAVKGPIEVHMNGPHTTAH
jgi:peptidoglycan/xylan/chitin deacetylase (PgdA/CDA1 family)